MATDTIIAGFYPTTAMPDPDCWKALWPNPRQVLVALGVKPNIEAIDLCCGDGLFTLPLASMAKHVFAIDIDPAMLALARRKIAAVGAANCQLIEGDAYAVVDLVRRPVDFVLIANTFHGVPDKPRIAGAVAAILTPGGHFAVVNWHLRPRDETIVLGEPRGPKTKMRMTPADVTAVVEPAGLRSVSVVDLPPYHYGAIFEKRGA